MSSAFAWKYIKILSDYSYGTRTVGMYSYLGSNFSSIRPFFLFDEKRFISFFDSTSNISPVLSHVGKHAFNLLVNGLTDKSFYFKYFYFLTYRLIHIKFLNVF